MTLTLDKEALSLNLPKGPTAVYMRDVRGRAVAILVVREDGTMFLRAADDVEIIQVKIEPARVAG